MVAVTERLGTIAAGTEYWYTPALVTRSLQAIDQYAAVLPTGPVLGVVRGSGSAFGRSEQPPRFEEIVRFSIWGYVQGDLQEVPGGTVASTHLNRLLMDVRKALVSGWDYTLSGALLEMRPDRDAPVDTDDGGLEPLGYFVQPWLAWADYKWAA